MLSESTVGWESRNPGKGLYHYLTFHKGETRESGFIESFDELPVPGKRGNRISRQKIFNIATYDRMRILMTELRRIVCERREIRIRLSKSVSFDTERIRRIVDWV